MTSAEAAEAKKPKPAELALVGPEEHTLSVQTDDQGTTAVLVALLENGGGPAKGVGFRLIMDNNPSLPATEVTNADSATAGAFDGTVPASSVIHLKISFSFPDGRTPRDALLKITAKEPKGTKPIVTELKIERVLDDKLFFKPILWGLIGALAVSFATWTRTEVPEPNRATTGRWTDWRGRVHTEKPLSLDDSWATNLTVIGGVLGTVLAATDVLSEFVPGLPPNRFLALSLLFVALPLGAPLIYIALGRREKPAGGSENVTFGTVFGLLVSTTVTLIAVLGQLFTLGILVELSTAPDKAQKALLVVLIGAVVAVVAYAHRTVRWLILATAPTTATTEGARLSSAAGGVGVRSSAAI